MKKSNFFIKTIVLSSTNIMTGVITFLFSIILANEIGSQGMGLYQLIMPLYAMFLFITGGGVTISMSKIAAEKKACGKMNELYKSVKAVTIFEFIWAGFILLIILMSGKYISKFILKDARAYLGILAFCPAVFIISVSSTYKGVYYGLQRVLEPALIDIFEKIVRISTMFFFVRLTKALPLEYRVASAVLSLSFGELASCSMFYIAYRIYKKKNPAYDKCDNNFQLAFNVLKLSIPLALNGILSTVFSSFTSVLIPNRLMKSGLTYGEALSMFGKLQGMALTIAFFPAIVLGALSVLIIPAISEATASNRHKFVNHRINIALKTAFVTGFSTAAIVLAMPEKLGMFFYKDKVVGVLLSYVAFAIPFSYIESTSFAILNGLGKQGRLLINSTILSLFDIALLYVLLPISSINIKGYAITFFASSILGLILNTNAIKKSVSLSIDVFRTIVMPIILGILIYFVIIILLNFIVSIPLIIFSSYMIYIIFYLIVTMGSKKAF